MGMFDRLFGKREKEQVKEAKLARRKETDVRKGEVSIPRSGKGSANIVNYLENLKTDVNKKPGTLNEVVKFLEYPEAEVRCKVAEVLDYSEAKSATLPLISLAKDSNERVREAAFWALRGQRAASAEETFIKGLDDPSCFVRRICAEAVGCCRAKQALPRLLILAKDQEEGVRQFAGWALGKLGDKSAIPVLKEALCDDSENVRINAARSLDELGAGVDHKISYVSFPEFMTKWK